MNDPDIDLVLRVIAADDRPAFGELVKRHQSGLRNFLCRLTRGEEARADDLAQETFIKAHRNITRFRGGAKFSTWLYRIAYRVFLDDLRRRRETPLPNEQTWENAVPSGTRRSDLKQDLEQAMVSFEEDRAAVFDLYYKKGMSHSEVGASLDMPLGTVKTHLARGLEILRHKLKDWKSHERTTG